MRINQTTKTVAAGLLVMAMLLAGAVTGASAGPGPGHFTSDNVQWISVNPLHTGSSGGRLHEGYFYVTDPRGVYIYDVSNPVSPVLKGSLNVFQSGTMAALGQEDPDTNGEILLVDAINPSAPGNGARLLVIDVKDKTAPKVLSSMNVIDHTWTCFDDCRYAIGRTGGIIDLTDPANPKSGGNWRTSIGNGAGGSYTHDLTEIAPGRLMTAGQPSFYIDSTTPTAPKYLTRINTTFHTLGYHGIQWPRDGQDRFLVAGTELSEPAPGVGGGTNPAGSDCTGAGEIATYDTTEVLAAEQAERENPDGVWGPASFTKLGSWRVAGRGTYADGKAPAHSTLYCAHWFDTHPDWNDGGLIAAGHYDWGVRFLRVDQAGQISEVGWFQPVAGLTASAYWITKDVVYSMDYRRGMDILRVTGSASETGDGPAPTNVETVQASSDGSAITVGADVDWGGTAPVSLGSDATGDAPPASNATGPHGLDLTGLKAWVEDGDVPEATFAWDLETLDNQPPPEGVRYYMTFSVGGAVFALQAKTSDFVSAANASEDPQVVAQRVASYAEHIAATGTLPQFRIRGNCATVAVAQNCGHVAWTSGEFDAANDQIRIDVPLDLAALPALRPGASLAADQGAWSAIQAGLDAAQTRDSLAAADQEGLLPFDIPSRKATATLQDATGAVVAGPVNLTVGPEGGAQGQVGISGLAPGTYQLTISACVATNCGTSTVPVTI